ncbi:MAG TPA: DUF3617 family protein [Burkholderiales bacterium]|nr:DUF3617 family protein [Burkholderiales bacterium]
MAVRADVPTVVPAQRSLPEAASGVADRPGEPLAQGGSSSAIRGSDPDLHGFGTMRYIRSRGLAGECTGRRRSHAAIALAVGIAASMGTASEAADSLPVPGLYRVEVRISLPNVQDTAAPMLLTRCIGADDLQSGRAFFVMSENPLKSCDLLDYRVTAGTAVYRIACPGPNKGSAVAVFDTAATSYHGTIQMNMGGKNMTMSEAQAATRIGDCR